VHVVVMPKLGLTMQEAELVRWLVEVGAEVGAGLPLCEVETDKITMEVEAPAGGILLRRVEAGVVVAVGVGIAVVGGPDEDPSRAVLHGENQNESHFDSPDERAPVAAAGTAADPVAGPEELPPAPDAGGRRPVAPVARRLAAELGVDLSTVTGTGPGGRIVRRDVEAAAGLAPSDAADGGGD
jgi:pyruvate dehydrogenase E2 component (dihydrolipoamide acetyltransferase)